MERAEASNEGSKYLQMPPLGLFSLDDVHLRSGLCSGIPVIINFFKTVMVCSHSQTLKADPFTSVIVSLSQVHPFMVCSHSDCCANRFVSYHQYF